MVIAGLQKMTLLDFPERVACTVFTPGCNFRCPFCHNASLVDVKEIEKTDEEVFFAYLAKRKGVLDGVAITGGEPTLQPDLIPFIRKIKDAGLAVKLDTNGSRPDVVKAIAAEGLVDYYAMDIKNSPEKYALTAGCDVDMKSVNESIDFFLGSDVSYEFRTTVVKGFHEEADFTAIGKRIAGAKRYFLQKFTDSGDILGHTGSAFSDEEMRAFAEIVRPYVPSVQTRGI